MTCRSEHEKPYWTNDRLDEEAGRELAEQGFLPRSPTFNLGRPLLNEVFYLQPHRVLGEIAAPTLLSMAPRSARLRRARRSAVPQPADEEWQAFVVRSVVAG